MVRNDFLCMGKKCRSDEGATLYEDLPSTTTRCPVCGSKRVQKIFSANVATRGVAPFVDAALERSGFDEQRQRRDRARANEKLTRDSVEHGWRPRDAVTAGFAGQMGSLVAKATAPWATAPTGHNVFAAASAGPNKAATIDGAVAGHPLPRGGLRHPVGSVLTRPRPDVVASDGKGRPKV